MDKVLNFLADNYILLMVIGVVLLIALIGFVVEGKKKKKDEGTIDNSQNVTAENNSNDSQGTYREERSTSVWSGNKQTWDGKVALIYPSDYMYASSNCYNNGTTGANYYDSTCKSTNWLLDTNNSFWTVSPSSSNSSSARYVNPSGAVNYLSTDFNSLGLRQSVYLDSSVKYIGGDGTAENPFVIQ